MPGSAGSAALRLAGAFAIGAIPIANIVARRAVGQDLRCTGQGKVSSTAVYRVAGGRAFAASCTLDVAKGMLAVSLAGRRQPELVAAAAGLAVAGHNWSPFLKGAGGRGVLPGLGALLVTAPAGSVLLVGGLALGWAADNTGLGCFAAQSLLIPALAWVKGRNGAALGLALVAPMLVKRVLGDSAPTRPAIQVYLMRALYDDDRPGHETRARGTRT
jgi:glycerol-3-phosphate acyltransferase PlsY